MGEIATTGTSDIMSATTPNQDKRITIPPVAAE
jgi:hypothetical protein